MRWTKREMWLGQMRNTYFFLLLKLRERTDHLQDLGVEKTGKTVPVRGREGP
jgi:hypothetical protein